jgi:uncharacterized protein (TIGR00251 family)
MRGVTVVQHILHVHVVPNANKFEIVGWDPWRNSLKVKLESKPEGGKANRELISKLSKITGHNVMLAHGVTSKNKDVIIECTDEEFTKLLNKFGVYSKDKD